MSDDTIIRTSWDEPDEFGQIFENHFNALYLFCQRRVGRSMAEDIAVKYSFEHLSNGAVTT